MSNTNLFIKRKSVGYYAATPFKPTSTPPLLTQMTQDSALMSVSNNPLFAITATVDPRPAWPGVTTAVLPTNSRNGIRVIKYVNGVQTNVPITVNQIGLSLGSVMYRRLIATPDFPIFGLSNVLAGASNGVRYQAGVDLGDGRTVGERTIVDVSAIGSASLQYLSSLSSDPYYVYSQKTNFLLPNNALAGVNAIESIVSQSVAMGVSLSAVYQLFTDWWDGATGTTLISNEGAMDFDLGLSIDSSAIDNDANAASDLYIILPASIAGSLAVNTSSLFTMGINSPFSFANYFGSFGYVIVPLQYLKTHSAGFSGTQTLAPNATGGSFSRAINAEAGDSTLPLGQFAMGAQVQSLASLSPINNSALLRANPAVFTSAVTGPF